VFFSEHSVDITYQFFTVTRHPREFMIPEHKLDR